MEKDYLKLVEETLNEKSAGDSVVELLNHNKKVIDFTGALIRQYEKDMKSEKDSDVKDCLKVALENFKNIVKKLKG